MQYRQRKSLRLQDYDYRISGAYYVTICVQHRLCLFGETVETGVALNPAGEMITATWEQLPKKFSMVELDYFVVMPNHFHGIIVFTKEATDTKRGLISVLGWFKTMTTTAYIRGVKYTEWTPFEGQLWQSGYWDRIIRNENALDAIRQYILHNPTKWHEEEYYG